MRTSDCSIKSILKAVAAVGAALLLAAVAAFGQQTINLTAAPTTTTLPDGETVPMWGYFCGTGATGSTASCAALNPASVSKVAGVASTWSPVVITVPTGQALTINLTNNLSFTPAGTTTANGVPTSIVILGQVGGGLGSARTTTPSPSHANAQGCVTWFIANSNPGSTTCAAGTPQGVPPTQGVRVQSMATEVAAGATASLTWTAPRPGTYLLESGTHPSIQVPMGLIGVLVVTTAPSGSGATAGTAYPGVTANATAGIVGVPAVTYNAELPLLFSEIDPVQNRAVSTAVNTAGFNEMNMKTFGDAVGSVLVLSGGSGYTSNPGVTIAGGAGSGATATAAVGQVITGLALPSTGSGSGYTAPPVVTFSGTSITAASAIANMAVGNVTAPTAGTGSNYVIGDLVHFTGGAGAGASGTVATVTSTGAILTVNLTNGGLDYTSVPTAVVGGSGATLTPVLSTTVTGTVGSVTVTAGGSGYVAGDIVTFSAAPAGGTTATGTVGTVSPLGAILTVNFTPGAGYTAAPTATVGGTGASLTVALAVSGFTVTAGGSGYNAPTATIPGPTTGTIALTVSTAGTPGAVYAVTVTNGGTRYSSPPSVTFASGTASARAVLSQSCTTSAGGLASGAAAGCYPSAVNYTPFYFLINGAAFNKTMPGFSLFPATAGTTTTGCPVGTATCPATTGIPTTGTVLLRLVNAGLRMHVPSTVGSLTQGFSGAGVGNTPVGGFTLIAEDGNVIPEVAPPGATTAPAAPRVQTDVFMAPGKTFDVMINVPTSATAPALPIYDRELSLSGNSSTRDAGMLAYIGVNGAALPAGAPLANGTGGTGVFAPAQAVNDLYNSLVAGQVFSVSDVSRGVIANDINVYGVTLLTAPANGTLTCEAQPQNSVPGICENGTFTYHPNAALVNDTFTYCANGSVTGTTCSSGLTATVTLGPSTLTGADTLTGGSITYNSPMATYIKIPSPGLLSAASSSLGLPLSVVVPAAPTATGGTLVLDANGGFSVVRTGTATAAGTASFSATVQDTVGKTATVNVTVNFSAPSNLNVKVVDAQAYNNCQGHNGCISGLPAITDYRWIIEEDRTFWTDPNCTTNQSATPGSGCPNIVGPSGTSTIPTYGVNFHASSMPFVAQGCTGPLSCESGQTMYDTRATLPSGAPNPNFGQHIPAVCDLGNGACRPDPNCTVLPCLTSGGYTPVLPSSVHLDPTKRYYISVLPGDAGNPFPANTSAPTNCAAGGVVGGALNTACGHTMSGAPVPPACNPLLTGSCTAASTFQPVTVLTLPTPLPTGKLAIMVFEDDFPLNGELDTGGGVDVLSPVEAGLGGFNIVLWDTYGGLGDVTGQDGYDMFNQPLSNSLAGTIDPATGLDACPISPVVTGGGPGQQGLTGGIVTCPKYESDGATLSPLAGQAVVANLMPEKFSVQAYPGADRIARGEEWLQTNTLDGQHPHDSFIRIGEPSYFQEFGPAGWHVSIGFVNPAIINARAAAVCNGSYGAVGPCTNTIQGQVNVQRLSRTPDQRLYPSGNHDALTWTQCWVSLGDPDAEDFMFTKCDANGNFSFTGVPGGNWRLTIGDQWNDQIIDGLSTPANVGCVPAQGQSTCSGGLSLLNLGNIGVQQWQSNVYTRVFIDDNKNGIPDPGEIGLPLAYVMVHYRDGHNANALVTDFNGVANFNETFPLFNWYVVEADDTSTATRYKTTGIHTVYDAGGPADGSPYCGNGTTARRCGTSNAYHFLANTFEGVPLPADLSVPGAVYCTNADCTSDAANFAAGIPRPSFAAASTGRLDPPWVDSEAWSGMTSQGNWIEIGKAPYASCPPACATVTVTPAGGTATTTQVGENGGIHGKVIYAATRPFDSAEQMIQQPWAPNVPNVKVNLYQEGFAVDGVTPTLTLVDTTQTSSWDDWAQGFYPNGKPYMSCPGQGTATGTNADLFYYTLFDQPNYLDAYNAQHNGGTLHTLPHNSQFKCYDAMHIWNQLQPAPYDGKYSFPSSLGVDPTTGKLLAVKGSTNGVASSMNGTNCTICVANPDSTDHYRSGTPMLPPGKYVVQVIMPPGYEVYKEEDKNLLIGDNFIAPATNQFGGLGGFIFIIPDQASVASLYDPNASGYNPTNFQNPTTALTLQGGNLSGVPGFPTFQNPLWPCVGEMRVVPDYLSLFPQVKETAPFAGATRPICDRKEVTLDNQMSVDAKFFIYTSTHIASKFTGVITDDFTSEFDPFAPTFGEKFSPPNMPVTTRDYLGNEISRVYSDHWGIYDGLTFSTWEVNPPNITGYSPTMMVQCMNDPGPILDTTPGSPTLGQMINDPLYNPAYSNFCYEEPYMPGLTTYLDTPVVPTQAFVGAGYNNTDCNYPDTTPAIAEVDGDGVGPYVSAAGHTLTITALGDQMVDNYGYAGPSASVAPFNAKKVKRHYGFGSNPIVTIDGVRASCSGGDLTLTCTVPQGLPACPVQQQAQYGGSAAQCGELLITAANGKQSVDTVTVTVGGKAPTHVAASGSVQAAIDAAAPGDLIIVDPTCTTGTGLAATAVPCTTTGAAKAKASHTEMLIMWKPVRLQGVGAASTIINANAHPAGKLLDPWRRHINCLFGLTLDGVPYTAATGAHPYDPSNTFSCPDAGWNFFNAQPNAPQIDRLPLESTVGWDAGLNGNLAEQLQEPSLLGAYEGAGITVLGKGVDFHGLYPWNDGTTPAAFPAGTTLLSGVGPDPTALPTGDSSPLCHTSSANTANPFPSNFMCNPSSIDGLTVTNSSQGGGGIFVHGWAHNIQIANNRVYNNAGTLSGGISIGQGEFAPPYPVGGLIAAPGSCSNGAGFVTNQHLPMCLQLKPNVHNNFITNNASLGDELFSATLSGGGGATFCTGNDYYKFNYNWVCGNLSSGEGGGMVHLGEIFNGAIEHNAFVFNQSSNPTIPTNGGAIHVMGTPDTDPVCSSIPEADCPPGLSDGTGPNLRINANLIQGNSADSGSGGGIRLQNVNGAEVSTFAKQPNLWNGVDITNNIIVNNVAGWDGAGISLQDALKVNIINNTIAHNDTLASSGVLTFAIGTPLASSPAGECHTGSGSTAGSASCPQSAGLTSTRNSTLLTTTFVPTNPITCPAGHPNCTRFSNPILYNDIFWQNRSFQIVLGNFGTGTLNQQKLVSLSPTLPSQTATGSCAATGANYWDIGVRGDTGPGNHNSGFTMQPIWSLIAGYSGQGNISGNPAVTAQYCNGSRVPPECTVANGCGGPHGFGVPPGISDAVTPNPVFSLFPSATVDEGNNWINVSWGPLSLTNPAVNSGVGATGTGNWGSGPALGNYVQTAGSPVNSAIPCPGNARPCRPPGFAAGVSTPLTDFFGNPRPDGNGAFDMGAVELPGR
ncbi:MAG TPA: hypothetical protein VEV41_18935 [Terriglobales bacterium]|nr:hypothetical protein [Terriglobales bacterium]